MFNGVLSPCFGFNEQPILIMGMSQPVANYKDHRFPPEIIARVVCGATKRQVMPDIEYRSHNGLNNRAQNAHLPFRKRERMRQGFRSIASLQHFVSLFSAVRDLFVPDHTKPFANQIRNHRLQAVAQWKAVSARIV